MDPDKILDTAKSVSDTTQTAIDAIKPPDEAKNTIWGRVAKTFQNKRNLKNADYDNKNIILQEYQNNLRTKTQEFLKLHPDATFNEANEFLLMKQIDDSTYSLNDEYMRDRFAKLIANTAMDSSEDITPLFSDVLSKLNKKTATLLVKLNNVNQNPLAYYGTNRTIIVGYFESVKETPNMLYGKAFISKGELDQLVSLGLVSIENNYQISDPTNPQKDLYFAIKNVAEVNGFTDSDFNSFAATMLTDFGKKFISLVY